MPVSGPDTSLQGLPHAAGLKTAPAPEQTLPAVMLQPATAAPSMPETQRRWWLWAVAGLLLASLAGLLVWQPWATPVPQVAVETVLIGPVTRVLAVNGRVAGEASVDVRPLVSGTLVDVTVAEGDVVTRAQPLMQLDVATQQAFVRQAVAGLDAALLVEEDAVATLARTRALDETVARVALEAAVRAEQTAVQEVARQTALLEQAQIQLEKFTIRAPIAGTVQVLQADPGQSVDPATVLMTIADLSRLVVETDVDESYATQIKTGQPAALQLSGEGDVRAGHVSFVSQRVDPDTGGLAVTLTPDASLNAPIGLTVTANITVDDRAEAVTVPRAALLSDAEGAAVLIVAGGITQRRPVQVIDWPAARLIVTEGLAAGDVIVADATGLSGGQPVKVAP